MAGLNGPALDMAGLNGPAFDMAGNVSCCQGDVNGDGLRTWDDDDGVESVGVENPWRGEFAFAMS